MNLSAMFPRRENQKVCRKSGRLTASGFRSCVCECPPVADIPVHGPWKSDIVLQRYIRDAALFRDAAATSAGL